MSESRKICAVFDIVSGLGCSVITIIIELRTAPRYETGNEVFGKIDIEDKAATEGASKRGKRVSFNLRNQATFNSPDL